VGGGALAVSGPMFPEFIVRRTLGYDSMLEKANSVVGERGIKGWQNSEIAVCPVSTSRIRKVAVNVETIQGTPVSPTPHHAYFRLSGFIHCHLFYKRLPSRPRLSKSALFYPPPSRVCLTDALP